MAVKKNKDGLIAGQLVSQKEQTRILLAKRKARKIAESKAINSTATEVK